MKESWMKEKARNERRAAKLREEMDAAIAEKDLERFNAAYLASFRCMKVKERSSYYRRFLQTIPFDPKTCCR